MHLIRVDFPDPEGPQTTIRSFLLTERLIFFNTWKSPYHLCISTILMMLSSFEISMEFVLSVFINHHFINGVKFNYSKPVLSSFSSFRLYVDIKKQQIK